MKINVDGEALKLLEDFIYYSENDPQAVANIMMCDIIGFRQRILLLQKAMKEAADNDENDKTDCG